MEGDALQGLEGFARRILFSINCVRTDGQYMSIPNYADSCGCVCVAHALLSSSVESISSGVHGRVKYDAALFNRMANRAFTQPGSNGGCWWEKSCKYRC